MIIVQVLYRNILKYTKYMYTHPGGLCFHCLHLQHCSLKPFPTQMLSLNE